MFCAHYQSGKTLTERDHYFPDLPEDEGIRALDLIMPNGRPITLSNFDRYAFFREAATQALSGPDGRILDPGALSYEALLKVARILSIDSEGLAFDELRERINETLHAPKLLAAYITGIDDRLGLCVQVQVKADGSVRIIRFPATELEGLNPRFSSSIIKRGAR